MRTLSSPTRRTPVALAAALTAATLVLAGCSASEDVDKGPESGPASTTLNAAIAGEPDQLDPQKATAHASFQVLENVFDTLVEPDERLQMQPALAESWTTAADQLSWTFTLRSGVSFHDGSAFDADDVVYSYERIIDQELANSYRFDSVEQVIKLDPTTVRIDLRRPTPNLLTSLGSFKGMAIVDQQNVDSGEIAKKPNGTGPFYFESYQRGTAITLHANDKYWDGGPAISTLKFGFTPEPGAALADLRAGQVQWTDNLPADQVGSLLTGGDPVVRSVPSNDYWYVALNQRKKPFNDARVRQAFAWALDREAIAEAAKPVAAQTNQAAIPRSSNWYFDYAPYRLDPVRAKTLLKQAGVKKLSVDFMVTGEYPETVAVAQVMKEQLAEIGVTLKIRTEDLAGWLAARKAGKFGGYLYGRVGEVDPDEVYLQHAGKNASNYQKFKNARVDELLAAGRATPDQEARKQIYDQIAKIVVDQASYIYLYNPGVVQAWSPGLTGYTVRADRATRFRDATLSG